MASKITFYEETKPGKLEKLCAVRNAPVPPVGKVILLAPADDDEARRQVWSHTYLLREMALESDDKWHEEVSVVLGPKIREEGALWRLD